jgi:hypothetical protein
MVDRLKCPCCGMPTIPDGPEDIADDEKTCDKCYDEAEAKLKTCRACSRILGDDDGAVLCWRCGDKVDDDEGQGVI